MGVLSQLAKWAVLLAALALVSCIDGKEEYWLNADRSGKAELSYSFPKSAARMHGGAAGVEAALGKLLAENPAITASSHRVTTAGDRMTVAVKVAFESALDLKTVGRGNTLPTAARGLIGDISATRDGRLVRVRRTIHAGRALPGAAFLPAASFAGSRLSYIVHLPDVVRESNATQTTDSGRTLTWNIPLARAIRGPVELRFTAPIPISPIVRTAAVAGGFALLLLIVWLVRRLARTGHRQPLDL